MTPLGEPIAVEERGLVYANRGNMHDARKRIRRPFGVKRWIACQLAFRGWHRAPLMQPGRFTELFFLDEATAFAAGHRPCALCRRDDYVRFATIWRSMHPGQVGADAIDAQLHAERVDPATREQRRHASSIAGLPDGAFVVDREDAYLLDGERMLRWTPSGYVAGRSRPRRGHVTLLTPPSLVGILRTGWRSAVPYLHPTARGPRPG